MHLAFTRPPPHHHAGLQAPLKPDGSVSTTLKDVAWECRCIPIQHLMYICCGMAIWSTAWPNLMPPPFCNQCQLTLRPSTMLPTRCIAGVPAPNEVDHVARSATSYVSTPMTGTHNSSDLRWLVAATQAAAAVALQSAPST